MIRLERRIDVTAAADVGEHADMAVSIYLPTPDLLPERPVAILPARAGATAAATSKCISLATPATMKPNGTSRRARST